VRFGAACLIALYFASCQVVVTYQILQPPLQLPWATGVGMRKERGVTGEVPPVMDSFDLVDLHNPLRWLHFRFDPDVDRRTPRGGGNFRIYAIDSVE
jgi:hypothetical protein